jgi:nitrogen fixation protein NifU and related proteins
MKGDRVHTVESSVDDLYRDIILDAYKHPRNRGEIELPEASFEDENPLCGDVLRIDLRLNDGIIQDAKFTGHGCAISQASAELLLERVKGKPVEIVQGLGREDVFEELGVESLTVSRVKCAMLSLKVLKAAAYGMTAVAKV